MYFFSQFAIYKTRTRIERHEDEDYRFDGASEENHLECLT